jgi:hypothetical protein
MQLMAIDSTSERKEGGDSRHSRRIRFDRAFRLMAGEAA